jgi:asparagine synthase (glutamine-hydrolysing)
MGFLGLGSTKHYERLRRGTAGETVFWGGAEGFTEAQKKRLLGPRLRRRFGDFSSWEVICPLYDRFVERAWERSDLAWMSYLDLNLRLPELLLMRVDKMTMAVGLEGRVPFLDRRVVAYAMSIPESIRIRGGRLKHILKEAVRGIVPEEVLDRPKRGFADPFREAFFGELVRRSRPELETFCRETDYFDSEAVARLLDRGTSLEAWYLLNFMWWYRAYL